MTPRERVNKPWQTAHVPMSFGAEKKKNSYLLNTISFFSSVFSLYLQALPASLVLCSQLSIYKTFQYITSGRRGGNLGIIMVPVCRPVFRNLPHSYTWPLKKQTHSYTWSSEMLTYSYTALWFFIPFHIESTLCCLHTSLQIKKNAIVFHKLNTYLSSCTLACIYTNSAIWSNYS